MWKKVWKLKVKRKVQHFLWRACHDRLPVGSNLLRMRITKNDICKWCGEATESIEHSFFQCERAKLIWKLSLVNWEGLSTHTNSFKDWWKAHENAGNQQELLDRQEITATFCGKYEKQGIHGISIK